MASKLCCTAEQEGRSDSPELPNARLSRAAPVTSPQSPTKPTLAGSRFTSADSCELHELRDIFDNAQGWSLQAPRPRVSRSSMQSLRSLHKMASMRSIIRRKFSKDAPEKHLDVSHERSMTRNPTISEAPNTVIKHTMRGPKHQPNIKKTYLRDNLLSDKDSAEGGYDSDAKVLDDIAEHIGKKIPGKRPSIHSIDWTPSIGSKLTPGSSTNGRDSAELKRSLQPYHIQKPQPLPFATRVSQVFSTPNLKVKTLDGRGHKVRRSHSATSMGLPKPSPISPLRLPNLSTYDNEDTPWVQTVQQSLRLSQFPISPRVGPRASKTLSDNDNSGDLIRDHPSSHAHVHTVVPDRVQPLTANRSARAVEIRVQQPTSITSPRTSSSVRGGVFRDNSALKTGKQIKQGEKDDEEDNSRSSVHLYSMRISHHLRSGSLLSWDQLVDAPELPISPNLFRERTVSDQSRCSRMQRQLSRHERQSSSSGFTSSKVPIKWGKVLPGDQEHRADVASSIYSSRPQSPPNNFGESMINLSQTGPSRHTFNFSPIDNKKPRRSNSYPGDNEAMSKPPEKYGATNCVTAQGSTVDSPLLASPILFVGKNNVAETKSSKFREELSPSPPKTRLTPTSSIIRFLNPKRLGIRSQSEANLRPGTSAVPMDGPFDALLLSADRERRPSRSLLSIQVEQRVLGKDEGANLIWDRALQAHQEEKAAMIRPNNKNLGVQTSLFRERSGSVASRRASTEADMVGHAAKRVNPNDRLSIAVLEPSHKPEKVHGLPSTSTFRRSAIQGHLDLSPERDLSTVFDKQSDDSRTVGAWGRYPSHTRHDRTFSAGRLDHVEIRDFALEAAIGSVSTRDESHDGDMVDPTERLPSPIPQPGEKKRKKKFGNSRMAKSSSMTFGKSLMKNYTKMFKSQSTEFQRHGRGHRSSIASGGILEFPELELVPDVWTGGRGEREDTCWHGSDETSPSKQEQSTGTKSKGRLRAEDSMATLRPRRNSSAPNLNELSFRDGADDFENSHNRARIWSVYYDDCLPSFPRASTEINFGHDERGNHRRRSFDSKYTPSHPHTMPVHHPNNFYNTSHLSRESIQLSLESTEKSEGAGEEKSITSVRRSTMDLISKFKEQEITEHERVLSLTRAESRRGRDRIVTL